MISKVAFFLAALAAVNATALLHGVALASTGVSSSRRDQDGFGNFAFRYDIDAAGASSSHAEVGSNVAKVIAAPVYHAAPAVVASHAVPTLLSAPIAAHGVPTLLSAGIGGVAPIAPALVTGHSVTSYGVAPVGLGAGIHGVRAYGPGILGFNTGVHAYGPGVHAYGPGVLGLNAGKLIL